MGNLPSDPSAVASRLKVNEGILALQIDRQLDARIWAGTQVTDRVNHTVRIVGRTLADEIEKSLMGQESFDEFEARMLRRMGVGTMERDTGGLALRAIDTELETEVRLAWNDGIRSANEQEDTVTVWAAEMDDHTTAGCWENHGRSFEEIGYPPPRHWKCRCGPKIIPNPESTDREWALLGREMLEDMAAEREAGQGVMEARRVKPSRFLSFREAA